MINKRAGKYVLNRVQLQQVNSSINKGPPHTQGSTESIITGQQSHLYAPHTKAISSGPVHLARAWMLQVSEYWVHASGEPC